MNYDEERNEISSQYKEALENPWGIYFNKEDIVLDDLLKLDYDEACEIIKVENLRAYREEEGRNGNI